MVRAYDPDRPVPTEVVDRLLEHAVRSPSAGFSQGWDFLVLETRRGAGPVLAQHDRAGYRPRQLARVA